MRTAWTRAPQVPIAEFFGELSLERIPLEALFLAGQAFRRYCAEGGARTGVLLDFFIGAHAQAAGLPLPTRDMTRYRTYFPKVKLIAPQR